MHSCSSAVVGRYWPNSGRSHLSNEALLLAVACCLYPGVSEGSHPRGRVGAPTTFSSPVMKLNFPVHLLRSHVDHILNVDALL